MLSFAKDYDLILSPVSPFPALAHGEIDDRFEASITRLPIT